MYIIKKIADKNGRRPALQTWEKDILPEGYVFCPEEFYKIFYGTRPVGFVNIIIKNNIVISMEVNQKALDAYVASLPEPEPSPIPEPTAKEIIDVLLGVN